MAYVLNAFIGSAETLKNQVLQLPNTKLVTLTQGLAMAPIVYEDYSQNSVEPFWNLTKDLFELGFKLSAIGSIGYFEIETFGGPGERAAVLWKNGQIVFGPVFAEDSSSVDASDVSNSLFSLLGVQKAGFHDEFDALGLGSYRSNEDWLASV
jgi:hypothetical protein